MLSSLQEEENLKCLVEEFNNNFSSYELYILLNYIKYNLTYLWLSKARLITIAPWCRNIGIKRAKPNKQNITQLWSLTLNTQIFSRVLYNCSLDRLLKTSSKDLLAHKPTTFTKHQKTVYHKRHRECKRRADSCARYVWRKEGKRGEERTAQNLKNMVGWC